LVAENDSGAQAIKRGGGKWNLGEIGKQVVVLPEREEFLGGGLSDVKNRAGIELRNVLWVVDSQLAEMEIRLPVMIWAVGINTKRGHAGPMSPCGVR
jgi:hypothetical protein